MRAGLVKTVRIILAAGICLVLACGLWQMVARALFHQELPSVLGYSALSVASGSMEPALSVGDLAVIHQEEKYQVGDVIAFWDEGVLTTHRAVSEGSDGFVTKGDFNNAQDARPVAAEQIAGRMVLAIPLAGSAILFLRTPQGLLLLLALGLLLIVLPDAAARLRSRGERCAE